MEYLEDLSSKAFKRADMNIHGKLKNYFLSHYPHWVVPGFNLSKTPWIDCWDIENVMGIHRRFTYNCDLPKPLLPPVKITENVFNDGDPALQLIATKMQIENDVKRIVDHYQKHKKAFSSIPFKKDVKWDKGSSIQQTSLPRYVADLADMIEMDPDPYFSGKYNWYYTGGALASVPIGNENLLLFPYMGELVISPVQSMENFTLKPNLQKAASCEVEKIIYETRISPSSNGYRILGRSKSQCFCYSLAEDNEKLRISRIHEQRSKMPLVSADLNSIMSNTFCTMDVERTLNLLDMISCKSIRKCVVNTSKILEDKWGSCRFMKTDPNIIIFADRCCVHYLDLRDPSDRPVLTLCPKGNLEPCESLCLDVSSCNEDHHYVASYHSILMCDRRSPQACVQQKWTHQFKSPPLLAAVHTRDEKEVIVLSSQLAGETAIVWNTWDDRDNAHSYNLPYTPPSILETLRESQIQGKCLDPSLRKRLRLCNAGITLMTNEDRDLSLLVQNSIGDIFYQCITHEEPLDKMSLINCQAYYAMESWEKRILLQDRLMRPLVMTDRTDMQHVFDKFTNSNLRVEPGIRSNVLPECPKWKQPLDKLKEYTDILAPELLSVWEVTEDSVPATQTVPHQKVLNWLEFGSEKLSLQTPNEDTDLTSTPVNTQELFSVSQQPEVIDIDGLQESYMPAVKLKTGRKPPSKKRIYVAGF